MWVCSIAELLGPRQIHFNEPDDVSHVMQLHARWSLYLSAHTSHFHVKGCTVESDRLRYVPYQRVRARHSLVTLPETKLGGGVRRKALTSSQYSPGLKHIEGDKKNK